MRSRSSSKTILAGIAVLGLFTSACAQLTDLPRLTEADLRFRPPQTSFLFDADGSLVTTFHGVQNRTVIPLRQIPRHVRQAVVAIEDERFWQHDGVDFRAIARAFVANVRSGKIEEGGSTITQQYVKNVIISPDAPAAKTIERKIDEAALARQLEDVLSKKQILARYLNTVYFGEGAYGIQAAARTFFGVSARELNLAQAALLASLIRSPEYYSPYQTPRRALRRRNVVLEKMEELGWAEAGTVAKASRRKLRVQGNPSQNRYAAPYFVDYVKRLIKYDTRFRRLGRTPNDREKRMFTGGLRIYTTVDLEMQRAAEHAISQVLTEAGDPHGALVAVEPDTGYVKAMVGGRDYFAKKKQDRFAKLNLAIQAEPALGRVTDPQNGRLRKRAPGTGRQAGSAFKPFALTAALESGKSLAEGYSGPPVKVFPGLSTNGAPWEVHNYGDSSYGHLSLLQATINSVNTVYAQVIVDVGPAAVVDVAKRMGIRTPLLPYYSAVLGSNEVNPLDMASAYSTFASYGLYHPPIAITKIVGPDGRVLYTDRTKPVRAVDPGIAFLATTAMQRVIAEGTGTAALGYLAGRPAAGKTGTAQEYQDAWFGGFTPDLAAAVWVGYPRGSIEMLPYCSVTHQILPGGGKREICRPTRIQVTGGSWPTEIWGAFMARALVDTPFSQFTVPDDSLVAVTIDSRTGCLASSRTPDQYRSTQYFAPGTAPSVTCPVPGDKKGDTTVPSVLGYQEGEAAAILRDRGFEVEVVIEAESSRRQARRNSGEVWKQQPGSGTKLDEGDTVTIWVNP